MGRSKAKTVLYSSYSIAGLYYLFIIPDTSVANNQKTFKRFFSALSMLDKTVKC